jgi:hypothetical protein
MEQKKSEVKIPDLDAMADMLEKPEYTYQFLDTKAEDLAPVEPPNDYNTEGGSTFNPALVPTDEQRLRVRMSVVAGIKAPDIAKCMGIPIRQFNRWYKQDLQNARNDMNAMVVGKLVEKIREGDNACIIFYLKTRAGFTPKTQVEVEHRIRETRTREELEAELKQLGVSEEGLQKLLED